MSMSKDGHTLGEGELLAEFCTSEDRHTLGGGELLVDFWSCSSFFAKVSD